MSNDAPHVPETRTWSYYVALVFLIVPVWSITPVSWLYVAIKFWYPPTSIRQRVLLGYTVLEVAFSIYHAYIVSILAKRPSPNPPVEIAHLRTLFGRILHVGLDGFEAPTTTEAFDSVPRLDASDPQAIDFRDCFRTWFHKAQWSDITRNEFFSWLSWSMFNAPYESLKRDQQLLTLRAVEMLERRAGMPILDKPTPNNRTKPLRLTLDPMTISSRPLVAYIMVNAASLLAMQWYKWRHGARFERMGDLQYLIRVPSKLHSKEHEETEPILFLHGLGIGLAQYHIIINTLLSSPLFESRIIIIPLQPHISQHIWHPKHLEPLSRTKTIEDLRRLISKGTRLYNRQYHTAEEDASAKVTVLSHSNGTAVHAWLLKAHPELVLRSCFVDPVIFCLWEGDVCYNFVYRPPSNAIEVLMRYYVGTEIGIANTIQRNFDWSANTLFMEDIPNALDPRRTMFFLGGNDSILAAHRVRKYLNAHGVKEGEGQGLQFDPEGAHGQALVAGLASFQRILHWLADR